MTPVRMLQISGAAIVLPDRVLTPGTVIVEGERITDVGASPRPAAGAELHFELPGHLVVPGFIDVHVHGVDGLDALDGGNVIDELARKLPRFGVTAFCPTSIACSPPVLRQMLSAVRTARTRSRLSGARVLPAHLESNFINPEFKGAQPADCLRQPRGGAPVAGTFGAAEILEAIAAARPDVGIVTLAPELDGGIELVARLVAAGHHVSLGHSGATWEQASAAIDAGARQATHLFNRMPPLGHRAPGLAGAVLAREEVVAEIVCDGAHVHPEMVRVAVAAKRPSGVMAITDGTAGSGLPRGSIASLGGRRITVAEVARLDDGTMAGSVLTMDRAFANLVSMMGFSPVDAACMCATTPARALGLHGLGVIVPGATADLVVLDPQLRVAYTFVAGALAWSRAD